ncbi:MAG: hypothetical protein RR501_01130 [Cloacibacillus sp.]
MMNKEMDLKEARKEAAEVIAKAQAALAAAGASKPEVVSKLKERLAKLEEKAQGDDATSIKIEAKFVLDEMEKLA